MKYLTPILVGLMLVALPSCAHTQKRRPVPQMVVAPVNPDLAPIKSSTKTASESTGRASQSTGRAIQIVERLVVAPGQEEQIKALKLELATTAENLKLTTDELARVSAQLPIVEKENTDLVNRWKLENLKVQKLTGDLQDQVDRADKAVADKKVANAERDVLITPFALSLTALVLILFSPLIRAGGTALASLHPLITPLAPVITGGLFIAAAAIAYGGSYWLIRLGLRIFVSVL